MKKAERADQQQGQQDQRQDAIRLLREWLPPGTTVYCVLRHVSRSGMQREISLHAIEQGRKGPELRWLTGMASRALGWRVGERNGLIVRGCGMDMGFHTVYELSSVLYGSGYGCTGAGCGSNDHANGDRSYVPHGPNPPDDKHGHWHRDGGYALRQSWI